MSVFRRFSNIVQQKSNAALDKMEDPSQAIDLSYQQLLEQQQKLRTALVEATTGQKRGEINPKLRKEEIAMQFFQAVMGTVLLWSLHQKPALGSWIDDSFQHFWRSIAVAEKKQAS